MIDDLEPWTIVFVPEADEVPVAQRIRRLLKTAKRQLKLRCVELRDATPDELVTLAAGGDRE